MKAAVLTLFLLCCVGLSFGQLQLAPNPACPGNAPFCRTALHITHGGAFDNQFVDILGFHDGVLYGWTGVGPGVQCPLSNLPADPKGTLCFYASQDWTYSDFIQENWVFQGQKSTGTAPVEIAFGPPGACSGSKYIYTSGHQILRATSASNDWNFTDVAQPQAGFSGLPMLPGITGGRQASFAIGSNTSGGTRLFYGNYPNLNYIYDLNTCQNGPYAWQPGTQYFQGQWVSDGGNVYISTAAHTSAANTEPPNGPWQSGGPLPPKWIGVTYSSGQQVSYYGNIYQCIADSCEANPSYPEWQLVEEIPWCPHAYLWHSDDCGTTWSTPYEFGSGGLPGQEVHGVEVDPANNSHVYVMVDSEHAYIPNSGVWKSTDGGDTFSHIAPTGPPNVGGNGIDFVLPFGSSKLFAEPDNSGGPLLVADKNANSQLLPSAHWPPVLPGTPPNTPPFDGGAGLGIKLTSEQNIFLLTDNGIRLGLWYFAPPFYDTATLLEDLSPPISSISVANGLATVTTSEPHLMQKDDYIIIKTPGQPDIVLGVVHDPVQIVDDHTFTFPCSTCPTYQQGMVALKSGIYFEPNRTVEVTDPKTNVTYLYDSEFRFVKPYFASSYVYQTAFGSVWGDWSETKLSGPASADNPAANALITFTASDGEHTYYIGTDQHIHQIVYNYNPGAWVLQDLTAMANGGQAQLGSGITGFADSANGQHVFYVTTDQHVHQLSFSFSAGQWVDQDVTASAGGDLAATNTPLSGFIESSGSQHVYYIGEDQHVYQLVSCGGTCLVGQDLISMVTFFGPGALAASNSGLIAFGDPRVNEEDVFYVSPDQHIYKLWYNGSAWYGGDVTATTNGPLVEANSALTGFTDSAAGQHVYYVADNMDIHQVSFSFSTWQWSDQDLTTLAGAPQPTPGSGLGSFLDSSNSQHVVYTGPWGGYGIQIYSIGNNWVYMNVTYGQVLALSATAVNGLFDPNNNSQHVYFVGP